MFYVPFFTQTQKTVTGNTYIVKGNGTGSWNSYTFCMYIRYQSNMIVLLINIWNQVTWNRFFSRLQWLLVTNKRFDSGYDHCYTRIFTQSPENIKFMWLEKEDVEQLPEGNELVSLV